MKSGHDNANTVECKIFYKYVKKIHFDFKNIKHCHDEPSVECENLMKMCHEQPEKICGVKTEKECKNEPEQVCEIKHKTECHKVPKEICEEEEVDTEEEVFDAVFDYNQAEKKCRTDYVGE